MRSRLSIVLTALGVSGVALLSSACPRSKPPPPEAGPSSSASLAAADAATVAASGSASALPSDDLAGIGQGSLRPGFGHGVPEPPAPSYGSCDDGRFFAANAPSPSPFDRDGGRSRYQPIHIGGGLLGVTPASGEVALGVRLCDAFGALRPCAEEAGASLGNSKSDLSIDVTADGKVTKTEWATGGSPFPAAFAACVERTVRGVTFAAGAERQLRYHFYASYRANPRGLIREGEVKVGGMLPPEVVRRIVRQHFPRMRACYERALKTNDALAGTLVTTFVVNAKGATTAVKTRPGDITDPPMLACIQAIFESLAFPEPEKNGTVAVTYPMMFAVE